MVWAGRDVFPRVTGFVEPPEFGDFRVFRALMLEVIEIGASDTFFQPGYPIMAKLHGRMIPLTERRITYDECLSILGWATGNDRASGLISQGKEARGAYVLKHPTQKTNTGGEKAYRFRVNAMRSEYRASIAMQMVMRLIDSEPATLESVGLDKQLELVDACTPKNGMVYMTGPTGSGKSTTFSALIRNILEADTPIKGNVVILDDPIEYVYDSVQSEHSFPVQVEIGTCAASYEEAIVSLMRHNPSLVVVQETRERATAVAGLQVANTGHLAYTTLHVNDVKTIPTRMLSFFPPEIRDTMLFDVINTARVFMNQILVPKRGGGRVALREHLILTDAMRTEIIKKADPERLTSVIEDYLNASGQPMAKSAKQAFEEDLIEESVYHRIARQ